MVLKENLLTAEVSENGHLLQLPAFPSSPNPTPLHTKALLLLWGILPGNVHSLYPDTSLYPCSNMYKEQISSSHQSRNPAIKWGRGIFNLWIILLDLSPFFLVVRKDSQKDIMKPQPPMRLSFHYDHFFRSLLCMVGPSVNYKQRGRTVESRMIVKKQFWFL